MLGLCRASDGQQSLVHAAQEFYLLSYILVHSSIKWNLTKRTLICENETVKFILAINTKFSSSDLLEELHQILYYLYAPAPRYLSINPLCCCLFWSPRENGCGNNLK